MLSDRSATAVTRPFEERNNAVLNVLFRFSMEIATSDGMVVEVSTSAVLRFPLIHERKGFRLVGGFRASYILFSSRTPRYGHRKTSIYKRRYQRGTVSTNLSRTMPAISSGSSTSPLSGSPFSTFVVI